MGNAQQIEPMLAKTFKNQNVKRWLMSEKLDGVRAIWNGSQLVSRNGNEFFAPAWFTSSLPAGIMLDGELYIGRRSFQRTVGTVRKQCPVDSEWEQIRYFVFDAPLQPGGFEDRLLYCKALLKNNLVASALDHQVCVSAVHLNSFFKNLLSAGAEGVMLRRPGSKYEYKRSDNLLKYKSLDSDDARVIGTEPGEGKHLGRIGALVCQWKGVVFNLGTGMSDALREGAINAGATVTFAYQGLTDAGKPRFPVFLTVRDYE
jgi:DNA ligase-1